MKWRLSVLVLLAGLTVAYRGMALYMRYLSPDLRTVANFKSSFDGRGMVVAKADDECKAAPESRGACLHPHAGDRIVAIADGHGRGGVVRGIFDFGEYLRPIDSRSSWTMVVDRPLEAGGVRRIELPMPPSKPIRWSWIEWALNLANDLYLPLLAMAAGLFIGFSKPSDHQAFLASLVFLMFSTSFLVEVSQFPAGWREAALALRTTAQVFAPYLILRFFLRFPRRSLLDRRAPWIAPTALALSGIVWAGMMTFSFAAYLSFDALDRIASTAAAIGLTAKIARVSCGALAGVLIVLALVALGLTTFKAATRDDRRRMVVILVGAVMGPLPMGLLVASEGKTNPYVFLIVLLLAGLFPLSFVYAVVRHHIFGIRLIVRQGLQYALLSRGFLLVEGVVIFLALYFAAGPILIRQFPGTGQSLASVGVAALTLGLMAGTRRLNRWVMPKIDRRFFRDAYNAQRILRDLGRAVRELSSRPDTLLGKVADEIAAALHLEQIAIFLVEQPWPHLAPVQGEDAASWSAGPGRAPSGRFELFLVRRDVVGAGGTDAGLDPRAETALTSRVPIADWLGRSLESPEALEVFPVDPSRGSALRELRPAGETGTLADTELFERFGARVLVPLGTHGRALGFVVLGTKRSGEPFTGEDRDLLMAVAEQVSIALDYSEMIARATEQEKLRQEIRIAQEVQSRLFPQERPRLDTLRYDGACRSARGVGGDYFDFLKLPDGTLGLTLADIAGKGLPAALLMASLQALVRSHATSHHDDLAELAAELNRHLFESTGDSRFATFFFGIYDDRSRLLRYVNAGHNPPLLLRSAASGCELLRLEAEDMVLGVLPERRYHERRVQLLPDDLLVIYSDGITEASNEHEEEFGEQRLVDLLRESAGRDVEEIVCRIQGDVVRFLGSVPQPDDMTLIVARVS